MLRIPELKSNSFWSKVYQPSTLQALNSTNPQIQQLDMRPGSLKVLASLSLQKFDAKQNDYRSTVSRLNGKLQEMQEKAKYLKEPDQYYKAYVVSSDSAAISGESKPGAYLAEYHLAVSQVATAQENQSTGLSGGALNSLGGGMKTIGIKVGNQQEKQVSVGILPNDTNQQALQKFAKAINNSNSGVNAEVKNVGGKSYLMVRSKETGQDNAFSVRDIQGSAVEDLQLAHTTQAANDAIYTVDGVSKRGGSNTLSLDNGNVTLQLKAVTKGTVNVQVGKGGATVIGSVKDLLKNYNDVNDLLNTQEQTTMRGNQLLNGVKAVVGGTRQAKFAAMGVTVDRTSGNLTFNEDAFSAALTKNPQRVSRAMASLAGVVEGTALSAGKLPVSQFIKPPSPLDSIDYGSKFISNSWLQQSRQVAQGMFLDVSV